MLFKAGSAECCDSSFLFLFFKAIRSNYIFESVQDRTGVQINTKDLSFPQISYYDFTKIINFVEIETVDMNSIFYCFHSFGSRLLSLFCAQKGRIYLTHKFYLHFHSNYMLF